MFHYQTWTSGKFWAFITVVFFLGMAIPVRTIEKKVEVPVEKRVEVVREIPAQCDYSEWKKLKAIDDWGFTYCTIGFELASQGFTALSKADQKEIQRILKDMKENNQKISDISEERQATLNKLGY